MVVGLFSFATSLFAIGLGIVALSDNNPLLIRYADIAYAISAVLFIFAVIFFVFLVVQNRKTQGYVRQIGVFLNEGRKLRGELLSVRTIPEWTEEIQRKVPQWKAKVQLWLDENLPEYAPGFDVEGFLVDLDTDGVNGKASRAAQHLEGRMSNLREILREIRI